MTKTPPAWVIDKLIADGDLTPDRHTRKARTRRCPACDMPTVAAIRSESDQVVHVDPTPTTSEGELIALMNGRRTFFVHSFYGIEPRFEFDITSAPADKTGQVHAEHSCHSPPLPVHPKYRPPIRHRETPDTDIPF